MDPNASLTGLRAAITRARRLLGATEGALTEAELVLEDLADVAGALDEWLSIGGFLPDAWAR